MVLGVGPACEFGEGTQEIPDLSLRLVGPHYWKGNGSVPAASPVFPERRATVFEQHKASSRLLSSKGLPARGPWRRPSPGAHRRWAMSF